MKVFITGGTGFIGAYVLRTLVREDSLSITAIKRAQSDLSLVKDISASINWIDCDIEDVIGLDEAIEGHDIVIHAAALISMKPKDKNRIFAVNVDGTANVVNSCLSHSIKKLIYVSSTIAMGYHPNKKIGEETQWSDGPIKSNYALSKYLGEQEVWRGKAEGLNVAIVAPPMVMGAGYTEAYTSITAEIAKGISYYPMGSNGLVDVRDLARCIVKLVQHSDGDGKKVVCSAGNISIEELSHSIAQMIDVTGPTKPLTGVSFLLAKIYSRLNAWFHFDQRVYPEALRISNLHLEYDNQLSKELISMQYHSIQSTIRDCSKAFVEAKRNNRSYSIFDIE